MYINISFSRYSAIFISFLLVVTPFIVSAQTQTEFNAGEVNITSCELVKEKGVLEASFQTEQTVINDVNQEISIPINISNNYSSQKSGLAVYVAVYDNISGSLTDVVTVAENFSVAGESVTEVIFNWDGTNVQSEFYSLRVYVGNYSLDMAKANAAGQANANAIHNIVLDIKEEDAGKLFSTGVIGQKETLSFIDLATGLEQPIEYAYSLSGINSILSDAEEARVEIELINQATNAPTSGSVVVNIYKGLFPHPSRLVDTQQHQVKLISGGTKVLDIEFSPKQEQYQIELVYTLDNGQKNFQLFPLQIGNPTSGVVAPLSQVTYVGNIETESDGKDWLYACVGVRTFSLPEAEQYLGDEIVSVVGSIDEKEFAIETSLSQILNSDIGLSIPIQNIGSESELILSVFQGGEMVDSYQTTVSCEDCGDEPKQEITFFGVSASDFVKNIQYIVLLLLVMLCGAFLYYIHRYKKIKDMTKTIGGDLSDKK